MSRFENAEERAGKVKAKLAALPKQVDLGKAFMGRCGQTNFMVASGHLHIFVRLKLAQKNATGQLKEHFCKCGIPNQLNFYIQPVMLSCFRKLWTQI